VITTPRLDAATVAQVERVLRETVHVNVERVAAPRQRLEDLFLEIVERARADRAATSGAQAGGPTAAFLLGEGSGRGEGSALIDELAATSAAAVPAPAAPAPAADRAMLDALVSGAPAAAAPAAPAPTAPAAPAAAPAPAAPAAPAAAPAAPRTDASKGVDRSVIDDLLGGGDRP
jgi:hypothetical protein